MTKYNISKPEKYLKDGVEKTYWANVGTMTEFTKEDGSVSRIIEIPAIGLKASIFKIEPKLEVTNVKNTVSINEASPTDDINPDDIPF